MDNARAMDMTKGDGSEGEIVGESREVLQKNKWGGK